MVEDLKLESAWKFTDSVQVFFTRVPGVHTKLDFEGACMFKGAFIYEAITKELLPTS